jgi:hypothetical protein
MKKILLSTNSLARTIERFIFELLPGARAFLLAIGFPTARGSKPLYRHVRMAAGLFELR